MIDEYWTWRLYGYHSDELKPRSRKLIVAVCDDCYKYRIVHKYAYTDYCLSCANSGERHRLFGKHRAEETRRKIGEASKRENLSDETLQKMSESSKRENLSKETLKKMSDAHRVENLSDETRRKMSASQKGKIVTENTRRLIGKASACRVRTPHTEETRRKISATKQDIPYDEWQRFASPWRKLQAKTRAYKNWRKAVFERDDYTCQMCNTRGGKLEAHHINPVRDNKNTLAIFDIDNGITLCKTCHNKTKRKEYTYIKMFEDIIHKKQSDDLLTQNHHNRWDEP